ncbi:MAG TPA: mitochondrial fission ELM1 family protein [Phenylobacterium sp.]|nr:mitochondrial fission ELM1 family protein [Phenylobacterium sp.]
MAQDTSPPRVWVVSDGRAGIENQGLGLAEAMGRLRPISLSVKRITWRGRLGRLPWWLQPAPLSALAPGHEIVPPCPDIWIAAGRAPLPFSLRMRRWSKGETLVVQLQDPRAPPQAFDLIIPPKHDRLSGDNVLPIMGSPHRVTAQRLAEEQARFADQLDPLPRPRVAVLIGGKSKAFNLSPEAAAAMANDIEAAVAQEGGSVMMTFSRRTPPYFAFLGAADFILATEDSTNMTTEAASTGKPVFILKMEGESLKFRLYHEELERLGAARPFGGAFHSWTYEPLQETDRAAAEVLRRFDARRTGALAKA